MLTESSEHHEFVSRLRNAIHSRDYSSARKVCDEHEEMHQLLKRQQMRELEALQRSERIRLQTAKEIALQRARAAGQAALQQLEDEMGVRQRIVQESHDDSLAVFSNLLREKEDRKPITYSTITNQLRQSEIHLARLRMFEDAEMAKRKLQEREAREQHIQQKERNRKVRELVEIKRQQFLDEERTLYTRMKGEIQVEKQHIQAEAQRVNSTFDHLSHDMNRAHYRQKLLCNSTTTTDLETALQSGTGNASRASRGSAMLRKIRGNRFTIPSLCDMYGGKLDVPRPRTTGQ